jgi:16S rRNA (guanine(966)-N(2))-methyltransferase RsmD
LINNFKSYNKGSALESGTDSSNYLKNRKNKMESRRQPTNNTASKPFTRKPYYKKEGDNKNFGERTYQTRDNRYQPRTERTERPPERGERPMDKDSRFPKRDGKFTPRNDRFQPKGRFAPKGKTFLKPWEKDNRPRIVSDMQVTDGKHRGKYLQSSTSPKVRPTARRIREVLFKILYRRIRAGRFLDLCAGAGTIGIESISRGAIISTFVERSAKMCSFIKKNLEACGIKEGHGEVVEIEVVPFLKKMLKRRRFWDVVYFNPPYDADYEEALKYFARGAAVKLKGTLVIEHPAEMFFPEKFGVIRRWRVVTQGDTSLSFYERK